MATARPAFICASCARALRRSGPSPSSSRALATASSLARNPESPQYDRAQTPRWQQTPPEMKMKFRLRPIPEMPAWRVNASPGLLNKVMDQFIGNAGGEGVKGQDLLEEEVKWLSVTHKSFEQGARGFNDRLALLGRQILDLQTSKALLQAPTPMPEGASQSAEDSLDRLRKHPALKGIENVTALAKYQILSPQRLGQLAIKYELHRIVRWQPRKTDDMRVSGQDAVLTHAMYAIIGAIALQRGGKIANNVARDRILRPLGL